MKKKIKYQKKKVSNMGLDEIKKRLEIYKNQRTAHFYKHLEDRYNVLQNRYE